VARAQVSCSKAASGRLDIGNRARSNPGHRTIRQDIQPPDAIERVGLECPFQPDFLGVSGIAARQQPIDLIERPRTAERTALALAAQRLNTTEVRKGHCPRPRAL